MNASFLSLSTRTIRNKEKDGEHVTHSRDDVMGMGGGEGGYGKIHGDEWRLDLGW